MEKITLKFAIYSRKSKFSDKGNSTENQIQMCKDYIYSHFSKEEISQITVFEDEGFSGKNTKRPQFTLLNQAVESSEIDCVVCYRLDRISRNIKDFSLLIEKLESKKISFISIKEQFDTSTPMGRAMMYITSVFSQLERETIGERIKDNLYLLAGKGYWLGGTPPIGFCSKKAPQSNSAENKKYFFTLETVSEEAEKVKTIFDLFIKYKKLSEVEKFLKTNNVLTSKNTFFSVYYIRSILKNPVYATADADTYNFFNRNNAIIACDKNDFNGNQGIMAYNKRNPAKDLSKWIVTTGCHKGLIEAKAWINVQNILSKNKYGSSIPKNNTAIKTKIICGKCGCMMYPKAVINKNGLKKTNFICSNKNKNGKSACSQKNISEHEILSTIYGPNYNNGVGLEKTSRNMFTDIDFVKCTDSDIFVQYKKR